MFSDMIHRVLVPSLRMALLGMLLSAPALAEEIPGSLFRKIGSLKEADLAVEEIAAKCTHAHEVILFQAGNDLPADLEWMIKRLAQKRIRVSIHHVSAKEIEGELERLAEAPPEYQELITFSPNRERPVFRRVLEQSRRLLSRLFGIQRTADLKLWVPVERELDIVKMDRVRGVYAGATAAASLGLSFVSAHLTKGAPLDPALVYPMLALGTWVYYNVSLFRSVGQVMSQGKAIQPTPQGWRVQPNSPFFWSASFLRSMMTNSIVQLTLNGPSAVFGAAGIATNLENSFWSVVSRSEIDKYIASRTPTLRDENGKIIVGPGQWTEKQAANVNFWWNFSHGMVKNLHLIQFDPAVMTLVFGGLAAINLGFLVKDQLPVWTERLRRFGNSMEEGVLECNTLLVVEKS